MHAGFMSRRTLKRTTETGWSKSNNVFTLTDNENPVVSRPVRARSAREWTCQGRGWIVARAVGNALCGFYFFINVEANRAKIVFQSDNKRCKIRLTIEYSSRFFDVIRLYTARETAVPCGMAGTSSVLIFTILCGTFRINDVE